MPTQHEHLVVIIAPLARVATIVNWLKNTSRIDRTCPDDLGPGLNATGNPGNAVTHRIYWNTWIDAHCRQLLFQLCDLAGVAKPTVAAWNGWTRAQKRSWFDGVRANVLANYGVGVAIFDNEQSAPNPSAVLAPMNLKQMASGPA